MGGCDRDEEFDFVRFRRRGREEMFREANLDGFGGIGWMSWLVRKLEWNTGHERRQQLGGLSDVERFNNLVSVLHLSILPFSCCYL